MSLSLKLSDTRVYEPQIRARLGTAAYFCEEVVFSSGRPAPFAPQAKAPPGAKGVCRPELLMTRPD